MRDHDGAADAPGLVGKARHAGEAGHGAISRRRILEHIRLLCRSGAGLEAIASPLCAATRDLIGADSGSMFWVDAEGQPQGFYHDSAPAEVKDIFMTRLEEFSGPDEWNMMTFMARTGPPIGHMLDPAVMEGFWRGAVYQHLCIPCGHKHMIEARVDVDGRGRALFCAWNTPGRPFTRADADLLIPVCNLMQQAAAVQRPTVRWRSKGVGQGHFITDLTGRTLVAISPEAEHLLSSSQLLRQDVAVTLPVAVAPSFAGLLGQMMGAGQPAEIRLPIADGRLIARASPMRAIENDRGTASRMLVILDVEVAFDVTAVEYLMRFSLVEALKKHLRAIFDALDVSKWTDLPQIDPVIVNEISSGQRLGPVDSPNRRNIY